MTALCKRMVRKPTVKDEERRPVGHDSGNQVLPVTLATSATYAWRILLVSAAVALLAWLVARLSVATIPLFLAVILASILIPPVRWLQRHRWRPGLAAFAVLFGVAVVVSGVFAFVIPQFISQLGQLEEQLAQATEQLSDLLGEGIFNQANVQLGALRERLLQYTQENLDQVMSGAMLVLEVVAGVLLTVVLLFFLMKDHEQITSWFDRHLPDQHRDRIAAAAAEAWGTLSGYFRGIVLIAAVDAVGIGIGLLIIGVPLVFPLMVLVFAGAFFPVVGAFVAGLVAVLVAFVGGGLLDAALTLGVIVVVQQIEGNILHPVIMRRSVPLHPIVVLLALTAGAVLAGIAGAFFAVPVAAVLAAAGGELYATRDDAATAAPTS